MPKKLKHTAIRLTREEVEVLKCTRNVSAMIRMCVHYMLKVPLLTSKRQQIFELTIKRVNLIQQRRSEKDSKEVNALKES
jgi:hypothetical protein